MKVKCIIVDDEPLAIALMKKHVELLPELELVTTCSSAMEAYSAIRKHEVELLFLDIQMPVMTGKEFLETMDRLPAVILTTAYREYAIESYEWDVVDYLLKPISFPRFLKAVTKFLDQRKVAERPVARESAVDSIYVNVSKKQVKVVLSEVLFIESLKDYIRIHGKKERVMTKEKISVFSDRLPEEFMRVHRSFVVNMCHIKAYTSSSVIVGEKEIPIGVSYKKEVGKKLH